ncbi:MAG: glycosyltransferase [SAR324 cluster bacterium]|nr:glycosyltransferase [SAR324 cluster bacterium]
MEMDSVHLALFFTYGVSLKTWAETGLLEREVELYRELIQKGAQVTFITYGDETDYQYQEQLGPIQIIPYYAHCQVPKSKELKLIHSVLLPLILRHFLQKVDLYKTNQMWGSWNAVIAKWLWRKKLIIRCGYEYYLFSIKQKRHLFYQQIVKCLSWFAYRNADYIHVASTGDKEFIQQTFAIPEQKIRICMNYIDTEKFRPLFVKHKTAHLLFIGRLNPQKNLFALLDAIKDTSYCLDLIGTGELEKELKAYIAQHQISARFLGQFANDALPAIINQYPVYILCSHFEGNPKTLLEAMACGAAVIGTDVTGIKDIIADQHTGLLCQTDPNSIQSTIVRLMQDEELQKSLGKAARNHIVQECSLQHYVKKEFTAYQELMVSGKRSNDTKALSWLIMLKSKLHVLLSSPPLAQVIVKTALKLHNKSYELAGHFSQFLEPDQLHPKHRLMNYHDWFIKHLQADWKVLDIGCGNGALAYDLGAHCNSVVGIDISAKNIQRAQTQFPREHITYICGDATQHSFQQSFDAIILSNTLEHIEHRVEFLQAVFANQSHQSPPVLLLRVPMIDRDWITLYKKEQGMEWRLDPTHYTEYTFMQLEEELKQAGLLIESSEIKFGEFYGVAKKL